MHQGIAHGQPYRPAARAALTWEGAKTPNWRATTAQGWKYGIDLYFLMHETAAIKEAIIDVSRIKVGVVADDYHTLTKVLRKTWANNRASKDMVVGPAFFSCCRDLPTHGVGLCCGHPRFIIPFVVSWAA